MPRYVQRRFRRRFQRRFQRGGAASPRAFGRSLGLLSGPLSGPPEGLACPSARALPPVLPRGRRAALRAVRKSGLERGFFALFAPRFPVRRGAPETLGGVIFRRTAENGPVQEKCEGVSSYGLWGLHARICAMNVRSERMSVSARFTDTAQLGRVCKKSVRSSGRGVQGGSLSKKLRLNCLYTCAIFYRIPADLKTRGFRPRNGCFPGRFRPGLSAGPARSLRPSPGSRFSALRGLPAALRGGGSVQ